jgi:hypothetical protein
MARRSTFDPFALERQCYPHALVVVDRFRTPMTVRKVPAGVDLRAAFEAELRRWAEAGWTLEQPFKACCFMRRGEERWFLSLNPDPDYHGPPFMPDGSPWRPMSDRAVPGASTPSAPAPTSCWQLPAVVRE